MDYQKKYIKYKNKYLKLKLTLQNNNNLKLENQIGGKIPNNNLIKSSIYNRILYDITPLYIV